MIGVVADDTTGANDIGIMFRKNRYSVKVATYDAGLSPAADTDVLVIDTDSRLDRPKESYDKVYQATKQLQELGCSLYFNKTCSVFRGNIGAEFDAMMDALGAEFMVIVLAFPKNGRRTKHGIHTVRGKLLEESEFANDPVHPMRQSDPAGILQNQTSRKVSSLFLDVVRQGSSAIREALEERRKHSQYCIIDAEDQRDLEIIAEAVRDYPVLGGSSALAEELPKFLQISKVPDPLTNVAISNQQGVLVVAGSLTPQTRAQTQLLIDIGTPTFVLDSREIFRGLSQAEVDRLVSEAKPILEQGRDVLLMADNRTEVVEETKRLGSEIGDDPLTVSKRVSAALADAAERLAEETGLQRLVVAGGDTSGTICRKLGITGNYVLEEIETGLPSGLATGRNMLIVLKSGSFGQPEFLQTAIQHLKRISG